MRFKLDSLDQEDPLEEEMATHSSILAGKSHGQRSLGATVHGVTRVGHNLVTKPPPPIHPREALGTTILIFSLRRV